MAQDYCKPACKKSAAATSVIADGESYPTPRIWRRCYVDCGCKCVRGRNVAARTLLYIPPQRRCYVDSGCKCVKGRNAAARTLLSHPTPPPRIWRRCHVECGRKCVKGRNAAARTLLSHPTPPHLETMPC